MTMIKMVIIKILSMIKMVIAMLAHLVNCFSLSSPSQNSAEGSPKPCTYLPIIIIRMIYGDDDEDGDDSDDDDI